MSFSRSLTIGVKTSSENSILKAHWVVGDWGACNKTCGGGTQYRSVSCPSGSDSSCLGARPEEVKSCNTHSCTTVSDGDRKDDTRRNERNGW